MNCLRVQSPRDCPLYVVLPYFNFAGFKRRRDLFIQFVERYAKTPGIRLVVSEALGPAPLPRLPVWAHMKFRTDSRVWIKENLINTAVKSLPSDWATMAWIDADLEFLNKNWVRDNIYTVDLDTILLPTALVNSSDVDPINDPYYSPVIFYAAYQAKFYEQSYGESEIFKQEYIKQCQAVLVSISTRRMPTPYSTPF